MPATPRVAPVPKGYAYGKAQFFGTIMGNQDWSTGWSFLASGAPTAADMNQLALELGSIVDTAWTGPGGTIGIGDVQSSDTLLTGTRCYYYPSGSTKASVQGESIYNPARTGQGTAALPTQTSLVASMRTSRPGRSNRGRMYLPLTGINLNGHQVVPASCADLCHNIAVMLDAFNAYNLAGKTLQAVVASALGPVPITQVLVDSRPDIQRRRADKVIAVYTAATNLAA